VSYSYDNADEQLSETQTISGSGGGTKTMSYTYNADGFLNSLTYPSGGTISYSYTGRNQPAAITDGSTPALVNYRYDLNGNCILKTLKNGTSTAYAYDDDNNTLTVNHSLNSTSFARFDYGYDNVHRRTFMQRDLNKGDVYSYDAVDQLTSTLYDATNPGSSPSSPARTIAYGLDAAGNRTSVTDNSVPTSYTVNSLNEYTVVGGNTITNNGNGDLATGNGWTYQYDAQDRLISASNGTTSELFSYDALNRNVQRTINGTRNYFYFDGWSLIEEKDSADALQQRYVHGAMTDEMISKTQSSTVTYYHEDALGNVVRLTNAGGAVVEQYTYDAFGAPVIRDGSGTLLTNSAFANRFLFTGREYLPEIGLYDYRNRTYHPVLGRFLQTDPLRFDADDLNLYRYVFNNPVNLSDPLGFEGLGGENGTKDEPPCKEKKDKGNARYGKMKVKGSNANGKARLVSAPFECCVCNEWVGIDNIFIEFDLEKKLDDVKHDFRQKMIDLCFKAAYPPKKKEDPKADPKKDDDKGKK
jgi:RHS repeat-associated protein